MSYNQIIIAVSPPTAVFTLSKMDYNLVPGKQPVAFRHDHLSLFGNFGRVASLASPSTSPATR